MTPLFWALKFFTAVVTSPPVSLPMQTVTSPLALSIEAGSMALAPSVAPVSRAVPPLLSLPSSSPQAATKTAQASAMHSR